MLTAKVMYLLRQLVTQGALRRDGRNLLQARACHLRAVHWIPLQEATNEDVFCTRAPQDQTDRCQFLERLGELDVTHAKIPACVVIRQAIAAGAVRVGTG